MCPEATTPQEPLNQNIAVKCTASEKRAVRFLSLAKNRSESEIVRDMTMTEIVAEAQRGLALLKEVVPEDEEPAVAAADPIAA
jgi:hypothetical protein